jgi:carnitine-CoA ligase
VPINLAFRGSMLAHLLKLAEPVVIIAEGEYVSRLESAGAGTAKQLRPADLHGHDLSVPELDRELGVWDTAAFILTSGTTGPSKLSRTSYLQLFVSGSALVHTWGGSVSDVCLIDLPLLHLAGMFMTVGSLSAQAGLAVRSAPALSRYWEVARETGATMAVILSTMVTYLLAQEPRPAEQEHRLRLIMATPLPDDVTAFQERFHIADFTTAYGMTEVPGALSRQPGQPLVAGYCGRTRPGFEVRLVDDHDVEVPVGGVGQAIVRTALPWMLTGGYVKDPAATVAAWRNGWFHTGDLLRRDADGNHFFVDRQRDALRRRGENISTYEVEREVLAFPDVAEVACVAERSGAAVDDEVKVWLVPRAGARIVPEELLRFCVARMPHFMVPRYIEVTDELPKTASARVQKYQLRERGSSQRTWDREMHGWKVTRSGLERVGQTGMSGIPASDALP